MCELINEGLVTRDEMFIAEKLYPNQYANPKSSVDGALEVLDLDYIDLMLLYHPETDGVKAIRRSNNIRLR